MDLYFEQCKNDKETALKELKNYYLEQASKTVDDEDLNIFFWCENPVTLYFINAEKLPLVFATYTKGQEEDRAIYIDARGDTDNIAFQTLSFKEKISFLKGAKILNLTSNEIVVEASLAYGQFLSGTGFIDRWLEKEYVEANQRLSLPANKLVYTDPNTIKQSKFKFREMLSNIDDQQFKAEFTEFLFGYNNEKFFLAASSLGGIIEHLMYLTLNNYGEAKSLGSRNPTAKDYLSAFERSKHIKFNDRDSSYFDNIFKTRNSFSHFNTGYALKSQCDMMLLGLTSLYRRFYLPSKAYRAKKQ